jgi:hypothetical protein
MNTGYDINTSLLPSTMSANYIQFAGAKPITREEYEKKLDDAEKLGDELFGTPEMVTVDTTADTTVDTADTSSTAAEYKHGGTMGWLGVIYGTPPDVNSETYKNYTARHAEALADADDFFKKHDCDNLTDAQ